MNIEDVTQEIIEAMAGSIHEGFKGAIGAGKDTAKIGSFKVIKFTEILHQNFGSSKLKHLISLLKELMVARAFEKKNYSSIDFYLSEQTATLALISSIEIFLNSKGFFKFSGKRDYSEFEQDGFQVSFLGSDKTSWEFGVLGADFLSVTKDCELKAQLHGINPVS